MDYPPARRMTRLLFEIQVSEVFEISEVSIKNEGQINETRRSLSISASHLLVSGFLKWDGNKLGTSALADHFKSRDKFVVQCA